MPRRFCPANVQTARGPTHHLILEARASVIRNTPYQSSSPCVSSPRLANGRAWYLPFVSHVFSRGREILHRVLQLHTVDTNPYRILLSHGMRNYVWDRHRCSLPSRSNARVRCEQVEYQDNYVTCSEGMERGKRGHWHASMGEG